MINQIDIESFGSFNGFNWRSTVKDGGNNVMSFKRLNIIYGRNYSGKTTLSRVFSALQDGRLPAGYENCRFQVRGEQGDVDHTMSSPVPYCVRVYNTDYVKTHLSFLYNQTNGVVTAFAVVGSENVDSTNRIQQIEIELGHMDGTDGIRGESKRLIESSATKTKAHKDAATTLEDKLRRHANEKVKNNRIYGISSYNITSIQKDIALIRRQTTEPLEDRAVSSLHELLKEDVLPDIISRIRFMPEYSNFADMAAELLSREVKPSTPIPELLKDQELQNWVKTGLSLHKDKRSSCAFCKSDLSEQIWSILESHFGKDTNKLDHDIQSCQDAIRREMERLNRAITVRPSELYYSERSAFVSALSIVSDQLAVYRTDLDNLSAALKKRQETIFNSLVPPTPATDHKRLESAIHAANDAIAASNAKSSSLSSEKDSARHRLRLNDIRSFCLDNEIEAEESRIAELLTDARAAEKASTALRSKVASMEAEISRLRSLQKDERKGADRVNQLLSHFFGHDRIKLSAVDNSQQNGVLFQVIREGRVAHNLSEGECSLVAFCYFIARLQDPDTAGKEQTIYIDDPISSLDSNHVFYIFGLIESIIASPIKLTTGENTYRYKQLFISTHNLEFLKYLKKLSAPSKNHGGCQYFLVERGAASSSLSVMPDYLRKYVTEFNFLFAQIHKCATQQTTATNHDHYYSFGNNLRKFLEAYLYYKYPHQLDSVEKLDRYKRFFGNDSTAVAIINRLSNELSHLEEAFDRSMTPIDIPEISKISRYVLDKLHAADPEQFNSLLNSIGEPSRPS